MAESNCRPTESQEGFRVEVGFGPGQEAGQIWSRGGGWLHSRGTCDLGIDIGHSEHSSLLTPL